VVDPRTLALTSLVVHGRARRGLTEAPLAIRPSAVRKTKLASRGDPRLRIAPAYERVFQGTAELGIAIPLVASGELHGVLNVEYPAALREVAEVAEKDEAVLIPLANQLSVALRNKKLAQETMFLRDYQAKLIEEANALIFAVNREGRITLFNRAIAQLTGFQPVQVLGRDLGEWLGEDGQTELQAQLLRGLGGGAPAAVEVRLPARLGEVRAAFNFAAIQGEGGEVDAVVAIGQDLTRLKALEYQVIQAEKLATLGQLAAGVVHELNNPLTSITVYADYLKKKLERDGADPADVDRMGKILEGAERILRFSRDLVAYARPSGEEVDALDLDEIVEQSLSFCEHILRKADARVERNFAALPAIYGIRGQLQQVFINLITNAAHAVGGKRGCIQVSTRADAGGVAVEVTDDGVGIRPEDLPHVFEPFFTTKAQGKGTGLGLSIVRNIIERHGGQVEVASALGQGARFTVRLPTAPRGAQQNRDER
jgi:PAS domain S-box-containing protein